MTLRSFGIVLFGNMSSSPNHGENVCIRGIRVSELGEGPSVFLPSSCPRILIHVKGGLTALNLEIGFTGYLLWLFLMILCFPWYSF